MVVPRLFLVIIAIAVVIITSLTLMIPSVDAIESRNHSISAGGQIFSYKIPIVGTLSVDMKYIFDFEVLKPSSIIAGKSDEIILSPTKGQVLTTFSLNGESKTFSKNLGIGNKGSIPIPFTYVGEVIIVPTIYVAPSASANSHISPELLEWTTMSSKKFNLSVNKNFDNFDTTVKLPMAIKFDVGGNINYFFGDFDLREIIGSEPFIYEITPVITEKIKIIKYKETYATLHVTDGEKPGYVKIRSDLKSENGKSLSGYSLSIYVDGNYKTKVNSNQWSGDINVGSGSHNFQAIFDEIQDKYDTSTIYKSSKDSKQFNVKSAPSPSTTQTQSSGSYQPRQTSSSQDYTIPLIILGIAGGGGVTAVIIMKNKKKSAKPTIQAVSEAKSAQVLAKSDEFTHKKEVLDKFATGEISKEEYLRHVGYEKKEEKKSESTKKTKRPKKSKAKSKKKDDSK